MTHESGTPQYDIPGYFAADGIAAETSADAGNIWRVHWTPDRVGRWDYKVSFRTGSGVAVAAASGEAVARYDGRQGVVIVEESDKLGRDLRGQGRLQYVGQRYLRFAGSGNYFLKAGPMRAGNPVGLCGFRWHGRAQGQCPSQDVAATRGGLAHGDPIWQDGKGKGTHRRF